MLSCKMHLFILSVIFIEIYYQTDIQVILPEQIYVLQNWFVLFSFRWKGGFDKDVKVCRPDLISYSVKRKRKFVCQTTVILKMSTVPEILYPIKKTTTKTRTRTRTRNKTKKQQNKS